MEIRRNTEEQQVSKGVLMENRMRLWDEYFPLGSRNSPSVLIAPMPTDGADHGFASYSTGKKIGTVIGASLVALTFLACAISFLIH